MTSSTSTSSFFGISLLFSTCVCTTYETLFSWTTVNFTWESASDYQNAVSSGDYIRDNNIITGLKLAGTYNNRTFVTVPRWKTGVPATLCEVDGSSSEPLLRPYPSWGWQTQDDCQYLQYVQSMEVDAETGYMWILDTGRKHFAGLEANVTADNKCPAKLVVWDVVNNVSISSYTFPDSVAPRNDTFLNDLALDPVQKISYISDVLGGTASESGAPGGLVVYDQSRGRSMRFIDERQDVLSMRYDGRNLSSAQLIEIDGYELVSNTNFDGIALSRELDYVYYTSLASFRMFRVPVDDVIESMDAGDGTVLRNYASNNVIEFMGWKQSQTDGWTFSNESLLYLGSFNQTSLNSIDIDDTGTQQVVVQDENDLQWLDTFAWGPQGYLYFTTNRLHRYFLGNMDWNGGEGPNMRVIRVYTGSSGYQTYCLENDCDSNKKKSTTVGAGVYVIGGLVGLACVCIPGVLCLYQRRKDTKKVPMSKQDYNALVE